MSCATHQPYPDQPRLGPDYHPALPGIEDRGLIDQVAVRALILTDYGTTLTEVAANPSGLNTWESLQGCTAALKVRDLENQRIRETNEAACAVCEAAA